MTIALPPHLEVATHPAFLTIKYFHMLRSSVKVKATRTRPKVRVQRVYRLKVKATRVRSRVKVKATRARSRFKVKATRARSRVKVNA